MKTLVVYDSQFGNTEKIAKAIAEAAACCGKAEAVRSGEANGVDWDSLSLLVVGSPTQGGRATKAVQDFLNAVPIGALSNIEVAAFDTRFAAQDHGFGLRLVIKFFKYAADKIAKVLESKGGHLTVEPEGFIVVGKEGPLQDGEIERAKTWTKQIIEKGKLAITT